MGKERARCVLGMLCQNVLRCGAGKILEGLRVIWKVRADPVYAKYVDKKYVRTLA